MEQQESQFEMDHPKNQRGATRTLPPLESATPDQLTEALLHWDELEDSELVQLASHEETAGKLGALRTVEAWMREIGERADAEAPTPDPAHCPPAEELYDFGRGPGFGLLDEEREARIADHVAACSSCSEILTSLQTPPPLPLDLPVAAPKPLENLEEPARPLPSSHTWRPFLVAASLAGIALVPFYFGTRGATVRDLPVAENFRGPESGEGLLFPRGRVVAASTAEADALVAKPTFEVKAVANAQEYRLDVFEYDGGAFDGGARLHSLRSSSPLIECGPLQAGYFTWKAWALVDGLERPLGDREFQVVEAPELAERLRELGDQPSESDLVELIIDLVAADFEADARDVARRLPDSPEKKRFLSPPAL